MNRGAKGRRKRKGRTFSELGTRQESRRSNAATATLEGKEIGGGREEGQDIVEIILRGEKGGEMLEGQEEEEEEGGRTGGVIGRVSVPCLVKVIMLLLCFKRCLRHDDILYSK